MNDVPVRYDVVVLETGMTAQQALERLEGVDLDTDPVVVVRRQDITAATYHRLGARRLADSLAAAEADDTLAHLFDFDAANEVEVHRMEDIDLDDLPYGVLTLGSHVFAFTEGLFEAAIDGPRRSMTPLETTDDRLATSGVATRDAMPAAPDEPTETSEPEPERFSAFPSIEAPFTVDPGQAFDIEISLRPDAVRHTSGTAVVVEDLEPDDLLDDELEFDLLVTGPFTPAPGSSNTGKLRVNRHTLAGDPFRVRLIPGDAPTSYDPSVGMWIARITVSFSYDGALAGEAHREVRVNEMGSRSARRESDAAPLETSGSVGQTVPPADVVLVLRREGTSADSTFRLEIHSPHLDGPVDAGTLDLGRDPEGFAKMVVRDVDYTINSRVSDEALSGIGLTLREKMPAVFFDLLETVWNRLTGDHVPAANRRVPDVLLLTDDWAVPWELLNVELDPDRPPFLGAQVNLGRWPLAFSDKLTADPLNLERLAVMIGYYQDARRLAPLPRAEEEGRVLEATYEARAVNADDTGLDLLLEGRLHDGFTFSGLHFAGHGESNPDQGTYLMYSTGAKMTFWPFRAAKIAQEKDAFIFVNACQVGTPDDMLGGYGGLAGAVTGGGFRAFVAPLWSVADDIAQEISLGLYAASAQGTPIAAYLRDVRARFFQADDVAAHTTYLAYTYYGHPRLTLGGPTTRGNP